MKRNPFAPRIVALLIILFAATPMLWLVRLSVTPEEEMHAWPPRVLPEEATAAHYLDIARDGRFWLQLANTFIVCAASTFVALALGGLGAYGLARRSFRGRDLILTSCLLKKTDSQKFVP